MIYAYANDFTLFVSDFKWFIDWIPNIEGDNRIISYGWTIRCSGSKIQNLSVMVEASVPVSRPSSGIFKKWTNTKDILMTISNENIAKRVIYYSQSWIYIFIPNFPEHVKFRFRRWSIYFDLLCKQVLKFLLNLNSIGSIYCSYLYFTKLTWFSQ